MASHIEGLSEWKIKQAKQNIEWQVNCLQERHSEMKTKSIFKKTGFYSYELAEIDFSDDEYDWQTKCSSNWMKWDSESDSESDEYIIVDHDEKPNEYSVVEYEGDTFYEVNYCDVFYDIDN